MKSRKIGIFNDPHMPFHDPKAMKCMLTVFKSVGVDELIINGDLLDMYGFNMHGPKHPDVVTKLEEEIYMGRDFLAMLRDEFPLAKIVFLFGNHEDRMERFILKSVPSFYNLLKLEHSLLLDKQRIEWYPYNSRYYILPDLFVQHSPPSYAKNGAMTALEKIIDCSAIYGCSHRVLHASRTGVSGKEYHVWYNGWLGSTTLTPEHARVFSYAKTHESWQTCAMLVDVINDKFFAHQFSIIDGMAVVEGDIYEV